MNLADAPFTYDLPPARIAQRPVQPPHAAKMLVIDRASQRLTDATFLDLDQYLRSGDVLVFNDTKVIPARFFGKFIPQNSASSDAAHPTPESPLVEVFLVAAIPERNTASTRVWRCIGRPLKRFSIGVGIDLGHQLFARVIERPALDEAVLEFSTPREGADIEALMLEVGSMPIPPYIRGGRSDEQDKQDYQTIFAKQSGSVAAPTASLHFTNDVLSRCAAKGVQTAFLTLHVGAASIRPVVREGAVHAPAPEMMSVSRELFSVVTRAKQQGARVIAVGTTVARAIESAGKEGWQSWEAMSARGQVSTDLFITPGFRFTMLDGLITNFHQPGTTHLLLVEATMGRALLERVYGHALEHDYRFLSYGDGSLIL